MSTTPQPPGPEPAPSPDPTPAPQPPPGAPQPGPMSGDSPEEPGRLEERKQRQEAEQQHGDSFAVDSDEPTDTSGIPR